ncbi:MAG: hypothetical protein V4649_08215 [Bacteroidota bacterium]
MKIKKLVTDDLSDSISGTQGHRIRESGIQNRISVEQYNKEINYALAQVAVGNYTTQEDLERESEDWVE